MPSPRSDQPMIQNEPNKQYIRFQNDSNAPIIKSNPRDDAKNVGLLNSRKSGLKFRNSNISFESNQEQNDSSNNFFLNSNNYSNRRN